MWSQTFCQQNTYKGNYWSDYTVRLDKTISRCTIQAVKLFHLWPAVPAAIILLRSLSSTLWLCRKVYSFPYAQTLEDLAPVMKNSICMIVRDLYKAYRRTRCWKRDMNWRGVYQRPGTKRFRKTTLINACWAWWSGRREILAMREYRQGLAYGNIGYLPQIARFRKPESEELISMVKDIEQPAKQVN